MDSDAADAQALLLVRRPQTLARSPPLYRALQAVLHTRSEESNLSIDNFNIVSIQQSSVLEALRKIED